MANDFGSDDQGCSYKQLSKRRSVRPYVQLFVGKADVLFMLFVLVTAEWCPTYTDYMGDMTGVLYEAGTAYLLPALGSSPVLGGGPCC